jgi:predicted transcriptional regulator
MKARDVMTSPPIVRLDAPAPEAARLLRSPEIRGVLVLDSSERLVSILTDAMLLRFLLPPYVTEAESLAGVLEERAAEALWRRLEGKRVLDLLPEERAVAEVDAEDTVIEVASAMVEAHVPVVAVREGTRLVGIITLNTLLTHLLEA